MSERAWFTGPSHPTLRRGMQMTAWRQDSLGWQSRRRGTTSTARAGWGLRVRLARLRARNPTRSTAPRHGLVSLARGSGRVCGCAAAGCTCPAGLSLAAMTCAMPMMTLSLKPWHPPPSVVLGRPGTHGKGSLHVPVRPSNGGCACECVCVCVCVCLSCSQRSAPPSHLAIRPPSALCTRRPRRNGVAARAGHWARAWRRGHSCGAQH